MFRSVNFASAPASLCPPRDTYSSLPLLPSMTIGASLVTWVAGLAACWLFTRTWPPAISSAACSLDLASPRRTSSLSSRTRVVTRFHFPQNLPEPAICPVKQTRVLLDRQLANHAQFAERGVYFLVPRYRWCFRSGTSWSCLRWVFPIHMQ